MPSPAVAHILRYKVPAVVASGGNDANTVALLHGNGTNGSSTITDSALGGAAPHTFTPTGCTIDTSQSVFGGASINFPGAVGNCLTGDGSSDFAFAGDLTIDFRLRMTSTAQQVIYDSRPAATNGAYLTLYYSGTGFAYFTAGGDAIVGGALSANTWYHIALVRNSGVTRLYIDGVQSGSDYTDAASYLSSASRPIIGGRSTPVTPDTLLTGWIDEFRVSNIARWTTAFTPPAAAYSP